jgi:hypothetical protein
MVSYLREGEQIQKLARVLRDYNELFLDKHGQPIIPKAA